MTKEYEIVDATVQIGGQTIVKQNIVYYLDGVEETTEFYSKDGIINHEIRSGYSLKN